MTIKPLIEKELVKREGHYHIDNEDVRDAIRICNTEAERRVDEEFEDCYCGNDRNGKVALMCDKCKVKQIIKEVYG